MNNLHVPVGLLLNLLIWNRTNRWALGHRRLDHPGVGVDEPVGRATYWQPASR
jgi:hypothetical protein